MNFNDIVARLLRSPLHGVLSGTTTLMTVTGKKSGRPITMPVNYAQTGDTLWVISSADRAWWRNLMGDAPVSLVLRGQTRQGKGSVTVGSETAAVLALQRFLSLRPTWASRFGVHRTTDGSFDPLELVRAAVERPVIQIQLTE